MAPQNTSRPTRKDLRWKLPDRKALAGYIGVLQEELRLRDWELSIDFDAPAADDAYADITPHENQKRAEIRLGRQFATLTSDAMRQTLVHELIHCHLFNTVHLAENLLGASMGEKPARLAALALDAEIERATDALADAMAPLMPMPPKLANAATAREPMRAQMPSAAKNTKRRRR